MKINILDKTKKLKENYQLFSPEHNFIGKIEFWVRDVVKESFVEQNLNLIESYIDCYENTKDPDQSIVNSLREIIKEEYNQLIKK
jgi:hypothetical protein